MSGSSLPSAPTPAVNGAKAALDGYEYQLDVSVLTALRVMLFRKSATRITLEPANAEDLEVDLRPDIPGRVEPHANIASGYKLVVQVKLTNAAPWTAARLASLLEHGVRRRPAKHHLDDPDTRYLLVTNAQVVGPAKQLQVDGVEEWPAPLPLPGRLPTLLPHAPEGRLAIWGELTPRVIHHEINQILGELLRVPHSRHAECRNHLREEARARMRFTAPGVWTREDLLASIRSFGGQLATSPELETFVPPSNFAAMAQTLARENAVIIAGPSGTGKTTAALALCERASVSQPGLEIVNVSGPPSSVRRFSGGGPTLHYVEDPWGQYSLRGGSEDWTEQLPRLLRLASPTHQFVITSRSDMLRAARADDKLHRWSVTLDADHYQNGELERIYDKRMDQLVVVLQASALQHRPQVLEKLQTPLELDLFFGYLADGPRPGETEPAFLHRVLGQAHRDAVQDVVVKYLLDSDVNGQAAVVWALLSARSQFDRDQLLIVQRQLRALDRATGDSLERLVDRLAATRHLRQPGRIISFAHPSVRAGFEDFIRDHWGRCEPALEQLVSALTGTAGPQRPWALETAARVLDQILNFAWATRTPQPFEPDVESQAAIDAWLDAGLVDPSADFGRLLGLAASIGSPASTPSELARWFVRGVRRGGDYFDPSWKPPAFDDAWHDRVAADPLTRVIIDRYIRDQLPRESSDFGRGFVPQMERLAGNFAPAYLAAARQLVGRGYEVNVGTVAAGAVQDLTAYELVLNEALDELALQRRSFETSGRETLRAIQDQELDTAWDEHFESQQGDGYADSELVEAYVEASRADRGWTSLSNHPRSSELAGAWARHVARSDRPTTPDELRAIVAATSGHDDAEAWWAVQRHWSPDLESDLEARILAGDALQGVRDAVICCALLAAPQVLGRCLQSSSKTPGLFVSLLVDAHRVQRRNRKNASARRLRPVIEGLPISSLELLKALPTDRRPAGKVSDETLALLQDAAVSAPPEILAKIVPVIAASGGDPSAAIERWLSETRDVQLAEAAVEAVFQLGEDRLLWQALDHERASARAAALRRLAGAVRDALPPRLLAMAADRGSGVRRVLVEALKSRPSPEHVETLVTLTADQWSAAEPQHDEEPAYLVARGAVIGLGAYPSLSHEIGEGLIALAEATDDRELGQAALAVAANRCGPEIRRRIWALAFINEARWIRLDAVDALSAAQLVEGDILAVVTADFIIDWIPVLAAAAVVLLSVHASPDVVASTMEAVSHHGGRRALLLLSAQHLAARDCDAAIRILDFLRPGHPARALLDLVDKERLPKSVLDDLGDVRIRKAVVERLDGQIA